MSSGDDDPIPLSTYTGLPCTGHPHDVRCIECATDEDLAAHIAPYLRDVPVQKADEPK